MSLELIDYDDKIDAVTGVAPNPNQEVSSDDMNQLKAKSNTAFAAIDENTANITAVINALVPHAQYNAPGAGLSSTQTQSGLEIGQTINIPLSLAFAQNDAGASSAPVIKKNGTTLASATTATDNAVVMSATPIVYQGSFAYAQGPIKNNVINVPDPSGRIAAGTVSSNQLAYQGFYKLWYDAVDAVPTTSVAVRALIYSRFSNSGNNFTFNTGSMKTKFVLVLPPGITLISVIDQDALNLDITAQYTVNQSVVVVNDASGNPVNYTIYPMSQSVPYSSSHRHNFTIG